MQRLQVYYHKSDAYSGFRENTMRSWKSNAAMRRSDAFLSSPTSSLIHAWNKMHYSVS